MAVTPEDLDPVLARAARSLQESSTDARWIDISSSIVSRVRATTRHTWPVEAEFATAATEPSRAADTLRVSDLIVRSAIRRALAGVHGAEPTKIDLYLDGYTCTGAHIDVVGVYGEDLQAVGDELAVITLGVLEEILGSPRNPLTRDDIDVRVQDIYEND